MTPPLPTSGYAGALRDWRRSLIARTAAALTVVGLLASGSAALLLQFVDASQGKAAAINMAGSLRMLSLRIGMALPEAAGPVDTEPLEQAMAAFETRLHDARLIGELPVRDDDPMRLQHARLVTTWALLRADIGALPPEQVRAAMLPRIHGFVAETDRLVAMIQADLETRIERHKMLGLGLLTAALAVLVTTLLYLRAHLMRPLAELERASRAIRAGDFSARVDPHDARSAEFGELAEGFNAMARDLSEMYGALEARVEAKTEELALSNRSLALLYDVARSLSGPGLSRETLMETIDRLRAVVGADAVTLCTGRAEGTTEAPLAVAGRGCGADDCGTQRCPARMPYGAAARPLSVPLVDAGRLQGTLTVAMPPGRELSPWQRELADGLGRQIATALANASRIQSAQRLALLEERTAIAGELHDSLAQALSYLKIQVTRLRSALKAAGVTEAPGVDTVVDELRAGLDAAYRQLRELLTTFRLGMDERGLSAALRDAADEFGRRARLDIRLDLRVADLELSANQQVHVLQTAREALANVEKHARAHRAWVSLDRAPDGAVRLRVDDDGVGLGAADAATHHYGLAIMQGRAHSLGGRFQATARPGGSGTRAELVFHPDAMRQDAPLAA